MIYFTTIGKRAMFTLELFFLEPKAEVPPANAKVKENPLKLGES